MQRINFNLKPCPFCGNKAKLAVAIHEGVRVECLECGVGTGYYSDPDCDPLIINRADPNFYCAVNDAIAVWNNRKQDE